ncbi:MAG: trypsin-like peptidase domain-containing protein [bacterium]|nr:trypsin-like peptidase domain-containing protein [bacterium]
MTLTPQTKTFLLGLAVSVLIITSFLGGAIADRVFVVRPLDYLLGQRTTPNLGSLSSNPGVNALPVGASIADVSEKASQSVVTVAIKQQRPVRNNFGGNSILDYLLERQNPTAPTLQEVQQDIGTGFVVNDQGFIVTNRHVVDNPNAEYLVIDKDNKEHTVANIYRDPANDLAILEVNDLTAAPLPLGDSEQIRVGESVIAIGTALGEFRHTVTTGVISGLGRGIQAGTIYGGDIESLDNVIQTDAAINPGNSGGPLIDATTGQVIGVNVAVSAGAQNVGFALPINVIKASLENFNTTGQFARPYLGIGYQTITQQAALLNDVPQGAYLTQVADGSSAAEAGLQVGDIITSFDGQEIKEQDLATLINNKKIGDRVSVKFWREGQESTVEVSLQQRPS